LFALVSVWPIVSVQVLEFPGFLESAREVDAL
jgi:hypothetical protein